MLTSTHQTQLIYCMLRSSPTVRPDTLVFGLIHIAVMAAVGPFLFHLGGGGYILSLCFVAGLC